jgi:hypothetical protein
MSTAPDIKYTDRDVRSNPDLRYRVLKYLRGYQGEFEPLVDAQEWMQYSDSDEVMPVAMVRKVLNCMRHDTAVMSTLPAPLAREGSKKKVCTIKKSHDTHHLEYNNWCAGVPFAINRTDSYRMQARVKTKLVAARTGALIHLSNGFGRMRWYPVFHDYGWRAVNRLAADTMCRYPSVIDKPILMNYGDLQLIELLHDGRPVYLIMGLGGCKPRTICPHCIKESEK